MITYWTRAEGNQAQSRKKEEHIGIFKLFLHRGINAVHEFLCLCNVICMYVTYTLVTVHSVCEEQHRHWKVFR